MKKLFVLFTFIACLSSLVLAEIENKYDRFKQSTSVSTKVKAVSSGNPHLSLVATYAGEKFTGKLTGLYFAFVSKSENWEYLECNGTDLLIDGNPFNPGAADRDGSVGNGYVLEFLSYPKVTLDNIKNMAVAKKVEVKICNTEFTLTAAEMKDLGDFVRLLTPEK